MSNRPRQPLDLDEILMQARYLLFDFDGPVCSLFARTPTQPITEHLRSLVTSDDSEPPNTSDWFKILAYAHTISPALGDQVADELAKIETAAVPTAKPTAHIHDAITACRESGRGVSIISNNSEHAVRAFLDLHDLTRQVDLVTARTDSDPAKLKPRPYLIQQTAATLGVDTANCAMIGDSPSDIQAARAAVAPAIGYAPLAADARRLTSARAQAIITSMAHLALQLRARPFHLP